MLNIKSHFPIFKKNPKLVYLDSSATSLKPKEVIDSMSEYYSSYSSNIHRGLYSIAERSSYEYESTRLIVSEFIGARSEKEIVFTKGTTESLNLIADSIHDDFMKEGNEIITTISEHHANFVPWQELSKRKKVKLKILDIDDFGMPNIDKLKELINNKTKIVSFTYVSNVSGNIFPVLEMIKIIREKNKKAWIILDVAQAIPHVKINVSKLDCDLIAFSGHKLFGPTGIGILWGKYSILEKLNPYQFGGDMIEKVTVEDFTYKLSPYKFEAGTPNISGVIGLKNAIKFVNKNIRWLDLKSYELELSKYLLGSLIDKFDKEIKIIGTNDENKRCPLVSFNLEWGHPHDIAQILADNNIAVRSGHHCAIPLHTRLGINSSVRASLSIYNTKKDIDALIIALKKAKKILNRFKIKK